MVKQKFETRESGENLDVEGRRGVEIPFERSGKSRLDKNKMVLVIRVEEPFSHGRNAVDEEIENLTLEILTEDAKGAGDGRFVFTSLATAGNEVIESAEVGVDIEFGEQLRIISLHEVVLVVEVFVGVVTHVALRGSHGTFVAERHALESFAFQRVVLDREDNFHQLRIG